VSDDGSGPHVAAATERADAGPGEHEGFDDTWLALREGADDRARDRTLESTLAEALERRGRCRILDLGAGTGANLRRLAPRFGHDQRWTLVDRDTTLLGRLDARLAPWADRHGARVGTAGDNDGRVADDDDDDAAGDGKTLLIRADTFGARVRRRRADLATSLDALPFASHDLIAGSALLDLAGADWLDTLAARAAAAGCEVLFALSYDGRLHWTPSLEDDRAVQELFDRHQRQDKGLGLALGPDAGAHFAERLRRHGLDVTTARSDWTLGAADGALQHELATGLATAATELEPDFAPRAAAWLEARRASLDTGRQRLVVGHLDVLGSPPR